MNVPTHINAVGETRSAYGGPCFQDKKFLERERIVNEMSVPERLMIAGGNTHRGYAALPKEVISDQMPVNGNKEEIPDMPDQLTVEDPGTAEALEPRSFSQMDEHMSTSSLAIEENPLKEMKVMRRQLGRLATRLYQMEDEYERSRNRELIHWAATLTGIGALLIAILLRR